MLAETGDASGQGGTVAYAIVAHSDQAQLLRLVRLLRAESPTCSVIVHWDPSKEPLATEKLEQLENVHIVTNGDPVEWGSFSLVEGMLKAIRVALEVTGCHWVVLLSGHDYPLRPLSEIEGSLHSSRADAFIDVRQIVPESPGRRWSRSYAGWLNRRYYFAYVPLPRLPAPLTPTVREVLARLAFWVSKRQPLIMIWPMPAGTRWRIGMRRFGSPFGGDRPCRHGSQWLTLSRRAADRVLRRIAEDHELVSHFKRTVIPDEAVFQTIICAEPDLEVTYDNRRCENWIGAAASHPEILGRSDVEWLLRSGKDFARKFREVADPYVLDDLDRHRLSLAEAGHSWQPAGGNR